jgi:hypothetical protein
MLISEYLLSEEHLSEVVNCSIEQTQTENASRDD